MKKYFATLTLISTLLILSGCSRSIKVKESGFYLGNLFEITIKVDKNHKEYAEKKLKGAMQELQDLDTALNDLSPISEISAVNNSASIKTIDISKNFYNLLKKSIIASQVTNGYFDITWKPLIDLFSKNIFPSYSKISNAKKNIGSHSIKLDRIFNKVHFTAPKTKIYIGHVKKGFAIDLIKDKIQTKSISNFKIISGQTAYFGNKIYPLKINFSDQSAINLKLSNQGITTLYNTDKYLKNYLTWSKYLDVDISTEKIQAISVVAPNAFTAEVLANSFFLMGSEKSLTLIAQLNEAANGSSYYAIFLIDNAGEDKLIDSRNS